MYKCRSSRSGILFFAVYSLSAFACGPHYPNSYLMSGDEMLIRSPKFSFTEEIKRIELNTSAEFEAIYTTKRYHNRRKHTIQLAIEG